MRIRLFLLIFISIFITTGCFFDPYQQPKYGELAIDSWFNNKTLGKVRKQAENIDEIVSRNCTFLESNSNKYIFSCEIVYKEKGETVIPLSKNSKIKVYTVFIKEKGKKYDYKVYNSAYKDKVWLEDEYLDY